MLVTQTPLNNFAHVSFVGKDGLIDSKINVKTYSTEMQQMHGVIIGYIGVYISVLNTHDYLLNGSHHYKSVDQ